jgi:ATP-binding cassette subfamily C (CFTR/MRP) protein 1
MLCRGIILERGTDADAISNLPSELYKLINGPGKQGAKELECGTVTPTVAETETDAEEIESETVDDSESLKQRMAIRRLSTATMLRPCSVSTRQAKQDALRNLRETAEPKEHSEKGSVKSDVYRRYISAASQVGVALFLVFMSLGQASSVSSNYVLRFWAREDGEWERRPIPKCTSSPTTPSVYVHHVSTGEARWFSSCFAVCDQAGSSTMIRSLPS